MPLANPVTSRRQALGLGAAACFAKIPSTADPDTELLGLCRQLDADSRDLRRHDMLSASGAPVEMDDDEVDDVLGRAHDTIELIAATQATTAAGIRAKAGALEYALLHAVGVRPGDFEDHAEDHELLAMSLVRDLGGQVIHG